MLGIASLSMVTEHPLFAPYAAGWPLSSEIARLTMPHWIAVCARVLCLVADLQIQQMLLPQLLDVA